MAILSGVYLLRGSRWARWAALAWIVLHVVISAFHAFPEFVMRLVCAAVIAFALFHPAANRWFASRP